MKNYNFDTSLQRLGPFKKLIDEININIEVFKDISFDCIIINDASTKQPELIKPNNLNSLQILNIEKIVDTLDVMLLE